MIEQVNNKQTLTLTRWLSRRPHPISETRSHHHALSSVTRETRVPCLGSKGGRDEVDTTVLWWIQERAGHDCGMMNNQLNMVVQSYTTVVLVICHSGARHTPQWCTGACHVSQGARHMPQWCMSCTTVVHVMYHSGAHHIPQWCTSYTTVVHYMLA